VSSGHGYSDSTVSRWGTGIVDLRQNLFNVIYVDKVEEGLFNSSIEAKPFSGNFILQEETKWQKSITKMMEI
jgi:hypothetical protein